MLLLGILNELFLLLVRQLSNLTVFSVGVFVCGPIGIRNVLWLDNQSVSTILQESPPGVLRYIGKVEDGRCSVTLAKLPVTHAFAQAGGTDNIIAFTTERYKADQPLVVKGPGAGPAVTAGGVFSDIIRLSVYLGAGLI